MILKYLFLQKYSIFFIINFIFFQNICYAKEVITILTEKKPPNNFENSNKKITGISTEIVEEIFNNAKIKYKIEIMPWARAYDTALKNKEIGLYSLARTQDREKLFRWIGPLIKNDWVFFSKKESKINIKDLEGAKKYQIGVYNQSALANYLLQNGFKSNENLDISNEEKFNPTKLEKGRIDLLATGLLVGLYNAKLLNTKFNPIFTIKETQLYLAFSKDTNENLIKKLKDSFNKIKNNEKIINIQKKYGYYKNK